jgi:hypothetical protein
MSESLKGIYSDGTHVASFETSKLNERITLFFQNMNQNENEKNFKSWLDEVFKKKVINSYAARNRNSKPMYSISITPADFEYFNKSVLNKEITEWDICVDTTTVKGTWRTNEYIVRSYDGGSSRKSKRTHRKPTKRRRNRRGNRKTKKN